MNGRRNENYQKREHDWSIPGFERSITPVQQVKKEEPKKVKQVQVRGLFKRASSAMNPNRDWHEAVHEQNEEYNKKQLLTKVIKRIELQEKAFEQLSSRKVSPKSMLAEKNAVTQPRMSNEQERVKKVALTRWSMQNKAIQHNYSKNKKILENRVDQYRKE